MRNAANDIFVANTRFQGVLGLGYGIFMASSFNIPFIASAVIKELHIMKL